MADFTKYTNYKNNAGISGVVFGANATILEVELNEMQEIQKQSLRNLIKNVIGDGITDISRLVYENGVVRILDDCSITCDGYLINCNGLTCNASEGTTVYLWIWEDVVDYSATLKPEGNQQNAGTVTNWIKDSRGQNETTRRKVIKYSLNSSPSTTIGVTNMTIAKIVNGSMVKLIREVNLSRLHDRFDIMVGSMDGVIGIEVDLDNNTITRVGDNKSWASGDDYTNGSIIYGNRKRCAVDSSGKIHGFFDPSTNKYGANITDEQPGGGNTGTLQFMVYQPAFYYKRIPVKIVKQEGISGHHMTKWIDLISPTPRAGFKLHPAFIAGDKEYSYYLIGENNGSICWVLAGTNIDEDGDYYYNDDDSAEAPVSGYEPMLSSIPRVKPMSGVNRTLSPTSLADMCSFRGVNWCSEDITIASAEQMLFAIEYATFNAQDYTELGDGATRLPSLPAQDNNAVENPQNTTLGNGSGVIQTILGANGNSYTVSVPVYRGVKNPFGNINTYIDGIILEKGELHWTNAASMAFDVSGYTRCGFGSNVGSGFISAFGYSEECDFMYIPTKATGDSDKPVGDLINNTDMVNAQMNYLVLGGNYGDGPNAGMFCTGFKSNAYISGGAGSHSDICSRLCWKYGREY